MAGPLPPARGTSDSAGPLPPAAGPKDSTRQGRSRQLQGRRTPLDRANPADIDALADSLLDSRIAPPFTTAAAELAGFDKAAGEFLEPLRGTDPKVIAWMLERIADKRRKTDDRYASLAQLVWSGPSEGEQSIRDTRVVLDGFFHRADQYVLISTYVIHNGRAVFSSLAQRIRERPRMTVEIYANLPSKTGLDEDERAEAAEYLDVFAREHWPPDLPLPALYYDPDARTLGSKRATLHAKCVVVDDRWAFITSANFTEAAQERNIEAGVLLDHPKLAAAIATRFRALRESGRLRRMGAV